jgi:hypothetical protein
MNLFCCASMLIIQFENTPRSRGLRVEDTRMHMISVPPTVL